MCDEEISELDIKSSLVSNPAHLVNLVNDASSEAPKTAQSTRDRLTLMLEASDTTLRRSLLNRVTCQPAAQTSPMRKHFLPYALLSMGISESIKESRGSQSTPTPFFECLFDLVITSSAANESWKIFMTSR